MSALKQETLNELETVKAAAPVTPIGEGELVHTMMSCSLDDGTDMFDGDAVQAMMSCS